MLATVENARSKQKIIGGSGRAGRSLMLRHGEASKRIVDMLAVDFKAD